MKTNYIYTTKAERIAKDNHLRECRKAGTAASFAYRPLEEVPEIKRAWLEAGIIEEAPEAIEYTIQDPKAPNINLYID